MFRADSRFIGIALDQPAKDTKCRSLIGRHMELARREGVDQTHKKLQRILNLADYNPAFFLSKLQFPVRSLLDQSGIQNNQKRLHIPKKLTLPNTKHAI